MNKFRNDIEENTIPLIFYILTSIVVVFISDLTTLGILFLLFLVVTAILFRDRNTFKKIMLISLAVIALIIFLTMLFSFDFSFHQVLMALPKSISFSIMVSTGVAFVFLLSTYQLVRISKTILPNTEPLYALIAGFRTVPVFIEFSKQIFLAMKVRGAKKSYIEVFSIYSQNIIIEFLNYLSSFVNRISFFDANEVHVKHVITYKTYILFFYFLLTLLVVAYELRF